MTLSLFCFSSVPQQQNFGVSFQVTCSGPEKRFSSRAVDLASAFRGQPRAADSTLKPPLGWDLDPLVIFYSELFPEWQYWLMALFLLSKVIPECGSPSMDITARPKCKVMAVVLLDRLLWEICRREKGSPFAMLCYVQQKLIFRHRYDNLVFRRKNWA